MLVLSRYRDESIYIGDDIVITVVDVRGDRVRLGIQAPSNVSVHRQEIYDAIVREKHAVKEPLKAEETAKPKKPVEGPPLERKLSEHRGKALPIDLDTPSIGFGGISDIVPQ